MAEGIDRIFAGGFEGGVETEKCADADGDGEGGEEDVFVDIGSEWGDE